MPARPFPFAAPAGRRLRAASASAATLAALLIAAPAGAQPPGFGGVGSRTPTGPAAAPPGYARYSLSNARVESVKTLTGSQTVLSVDWTRTAPGAGGTIDLHVWDGRSLGFMKTGWKTQLPNPDEPDPDADEEGEANPGEAGNGAVSGTVRMGIGRFGMPFTGAAANDPRLEIYASCYAPGLLDTDLIVSNVVRLGSIEHPTSPRALTAEERAMLRRATPPDAAPEGYALATEETTLLPGMPVRIGVDGEWADAEVLALDGARATVRRLDAPTRDRFGRELPVQPQSVSVLHGWMAVAEGTLAEAAANPERFRPSLRVQPGGLLALPDGAVPLPADADFDTIIPPGTPLLVEHDRRWVKAVLRGPLGEDQLVVRDGLGKDANEIAKERSQAAVRTYILKRLEDPQAVARFRENAEVWGPLPGTNLTSAEGADGAGGEAANDDAPPQTPRERMEAARAKAQAAMSGGFTPPPGAPPGRLVSAPPDRPLPRGGMTPPADLFLPNGTLVYYSWGRSWKETKVVGAGDSDPVCTRNFGDSDFFNKYYLRSHLAIARDDVRALRANPRVADDDAADAAPADADPGETPAANGGPAADPMTDAAGDPIPEDEIQDKPVTADLPVGSQFLPERLTVPAGTPLRGQWRRGLTPITVLETSAAGPIRVRWDRYGELFDGWVRRDQLVIDSAAAAALEAE